MFSWRNVHYIVASIPSTSLLDRLFLQCMSLPMDWHAPIILLAFFIFLFQTTRLASYSPHTNGATLSPSDPVDFSSTPITNLSNSFSSRIHLFLTCHSHYCLAAEINSIVLLTSSIPFINELVASKSLLLADSGMNSGPTIVGISSPSKRLAVILWNIPFPSASSFRTWISSATPYVVPECSMNGQCRALCRPLSLFPQQSCWKVKMANQSICYQRELWALYRSRQGMDYAYLWQILDKYLFQNILDVWYKRSFSNRSSLIADPKIAKTVYNLVSTYNIGRNRLIQMILLLGDVMYSTLP